MTTPRKFVFFHRDFRAFTGGHLKVWNYFNHVGASATHEARIAFSPQTVWDPTNPWSNSKEQIVQWQPEKADLLFLAGMDWSVLPEATRARYAKPIINLIQHPRHAEAKSELRSFLRARAIRICVSAEVSDAIQATGEVNGPVLTIPNGIDLELMPRSKSWNERAADILICGLKAPELTRVVSAALDHDHVTVQALTERIPRQEYLARLANARITVFLPRPAEGFYLPALEGMASGTVVVCPDCVGNRGFCHDGTNCFRPRYDAEEIALAARIALQQSEATRARMLEKARKTAQQHSLATERESFLSILARVDDLWNG